MTDNSEIMVAKQKQPELVFAVIVLGICIIAAAVGLAVWLCRDKSPHISFTEWVPLKSAGKDNGGFRFAIANMVSAEETWSTYKNLVDYIGSYVGNRTSMVLKPSYADVRILLKRKEVDLAFICTGTYIACICTDTHVECSQAGIAEVLVVPQFKNDIKYRSLFLVRTDSAINTVEDLRGRSFAFTDPESNTGCVVPTWLVRQKSQTPETYFGNIIYTGSHDRSIFAVVNNIVDGASVDSLVFYSLVKAHPEIKSQLRVIWESDAFGAPPIVVPTGLSKDIKEKLQNTFLSMAGDARGRKILDDLDIECFRKPEDGEYDSAYEIWKTVNAQK